MFRSTGSYEPDRNRNDNLTEVKSFDPQALTSLTLKILYLPHLLLGFDPQALTSLTDARSVCSYAPRRFDPQALTSLTEDFIMEDIKKNVSIHRLLRA